MLEWLQDLADLCMHPAGLQVRSDLAGAESIGHVLESFPAGAVQQVQ